MALSAILAVCLNTNDGSMSCSVSGRQMPTAVISEQQCSDQVNADINDALLESGHSGFAYGTCSDPSAYVAVTNAAVDYLKSQGYTVNFIPFKEL